jgi:hypothetical protein
MGSVEDGTCAREDEESQLLKAVAGEQMMMMT